MSREQITKIIKIITESPRDDKEEHFRQVYHNFATKYPVLFKMACEDKEFDNTTLHYLLDMMESIQNNTKTKKEADEEIGYTMFNKFVDVEKLKAEGETKL